MTVIPLLNIDLPGAHNDFFAHLVPTYLFVSGISAWPTYGDSQDQK